MAGSDQRFFFHSRKASYTGMLQAVEDDVLVDFVGVYADIGRCFFTCLLYTSDAADE